MDQLYQPRDLQARGSLSRTSSTIRTIAVILAAVVIPSLLAYSLTTGNEVQVLAGVIAILGLLTILAEPFVGLVLFMALLYLRPEETFPVLAGMRFTLGIAFVTLVASWFKFFLNRDTVVQ